MTKKERTRKEAEIDARGKQAVRMACYAALEVELLALDESGQIDSQDFTDEDRRTALEFIEDQVGDVVWEVLRRTAQLVPLLPTEDEDEDEDGSPPESEDEDEDEDEETNNSKLGIDSKLYSLELDDDLKG